MTDAPAAVPPHLRAAPIIIGHQKRKGPPSLRTSVARKKKQSRINYRSQNKIDEPVTPFSLHIYRNKTELNLNDI
jgi:hypothetical protein